ncbi:MAG: exodeoxyribonuclease VII small subunit [Melioribacteraceae bacterium]|nr:exodeoxyribonuclease VII small subunit [Melioribacteraceae bacterium]MCF8353104.1 exodeoxyribonuclease VII small subunit [Melioribacteraceae bacterium]MCF8392750.1 exodeoxyribonuclease VII small subunit [Melioribacteraceae bacterium]MCF8418281.1 exodeoxyribonuclease VII small subunit [Melioribacteraceae bacterium]
MVKKKTKSFEELLIRLQEISDLLDSEDIGLDESIALYEEGINLSKSCYKRLKEAELKITELKAQLDDEVDSIDAED